MNSNAKNVITSLTAIGLLIGNQFPLEFITIPSLNANAQESVPGDINGDGEVTSSDALNVLQIVVGAKDNDVNCDVDKDGTVTSADALLLLRVVIGTATLTPETYEVNLGNMYTSTVSELQKEHTLTKYYDKTYDIYFYHVEDLGNTIVSYDVDNPDDIILTASDCGIVADGIEIGMSLNEVEEKVGSDKLTYRTSQEYSGYSSDFVQYSTLVDNELVLVMLSYMNNVITGGAVIDFLTGVMISSQISK